VQYKILLGVPCSGTLSYASAQAAFLATTRHEPRLAPSHASGYHFNSLWCAALNLGMSGAITHFAMIHSDLTVIEDEPGLLWLDRLAEEMDAHNADFISTAMAIKDDRGLTSCGIGDPDDRWQPWRRFTVRELTEDLPRTFCIADTPSPDKFLLHNNALCLWDMRRPLWYVPDEQGSCRCVFNYVEDVRLVGGRWVKREESEDWLFSRQLWQMGARTCITSRVTTVHHGLAGYKNRGTHGTFQNGDENTAHKWRHADGKVQA